MPHRNTSTHRQRKCQRCAHVLWCVSRHCHKPIQPKRNRWCHNHLCKRVHFVLIRKRGVAARNDTTARSLPLCDRTYLPAGICEQKLLQVMQHVTGNHTKPISIPGCVDVCRAMVVLACSALSNPMSTGNVDAIMSAVSRATLASPSTIFVSISHPPTTRASHHPPSRVHVGVLKLRES